MTNTIYLVGKIICNYRTIENDVKEEYVVADVVIERGKKEKDGVYYTDAIPIAFSSNLVKHVKKYCTTGGTMGVTGKLQVWGKDNLLVVADKVSFLAKN